MRFYSHWIHVIWLYRFVNVYYPIATKHLNTVVLFLYAVMGGCDYAIRMYEVWKNRLHAVNENPSVADNFSLGEFFVAFLASFSSAFWLLDNLCPPWVWSIVLLCSWIGHYLLDRRWRSHFNRLQHAAYRHVPI